MENYEESGEKSRLERLVKELEETNRILRHVYAWPTIIMRGLVFGLATVVGATFLAGLTTAILEIFIDVPFI